MSILNEGMALLSFSCLDPKVYKWLAAIEQDPIRYELSGRQRRELPKLDNVVLSSRSIHASPYLKPIFPLY